MLKCIEDKGIGSFGYNRIRGYFIDLGFADVFDWFYEKNQGKTNGYHNNTHTFTVVQLVKQYCDFKKLNKELTKAYLTAALFHDFNHSGGKLKDNENIAIALEGLHHMVADLGLAIPSTKNHMLTAHRLLMIYLINATKYPYKDLKVDKNSHLRVLREADILSYEHKKWKEYVFNGLCDELNLGRNNKQDNLRKMLDFHKDLLQKEIKLAFFNDLKEKHQDSFEKNVLQEMKV